MTLDDFRQSLSATEPPAGVTLALEGGGTRRAIGRERTNRHNKMKDTMARGCMPTYIAKKAIRATQDIGIAGLASPCAASRWMRNG
jgi:hypothetical protein